MAAEDASIDVEFVKDHITQPLEETHPLGVVGQDPQMHHVGVRDQDPRFFPDRRAQTLGGIPIVGAQCNWSVQRANPSLDRRHLVVRQRLGGIEQKGSCLGIAKQRVQDRQDISERLARSRSRGQDHILSAQYRVNRGRLMRVERPYTQ